MFNTVLFDLDGTLLPLNLDIFTKRYFELMGAHFQGITDPKTLIKNIWTATEAMIKSTDDRTNEAVFMDNFGELIGRENLPSYQKNFDDFYDVPFLKAKDTVQESTAMRESVKILREKGYRLIIATNPLFPKKAIYERIKWSGFEPEDFEYISYYEKNHYCKPNPQFFEEILKELDLQPQDCIMVGNDMQEDMIAATLGIDTYLITDYLIDRKTGNVNCNNSGTYEDFLNFVTNAPIVK